jgi:tetratricopeptide (TPR) repeat protein
VNPPETVAPPAKGEAPSAGSAAEEAPPANIASPVDHARAYYHYMLARRYKELAGIENRSDFVDKAVSEYKEAIEADPDSLFLRVELADLYSRISRVGDAVREAEAVLKVNPNQEDAHRLLADIYFRNLGEAQPEGKAKESLQKAILHLEAVTRLDPNDSASKILLGRLYKLNNQTAKAEETFKSVLTTDPGSRGALANLAEVYTDQGDYKEAIALLTKVPENEMDVRWLGLLGFAYTQNRDFDHAVATYEKALAQDPDNQDVLHAYAESLLAAGKSAQARGVYEKILKAEPDDGITYLRLGHLDREEGKFDNSRQELTRAKSLLPDNLEVPFEEVLLEDAVGNDDKAVQLLQDLLKRSEHPEGSYTAAEANNRAIFLEHLGGIYRTQEKYAEAIEVYRQVVTLGKTQAPRGEALIVETLRLSRQPQKALAEADAAINKYPQDRSLKLLRASLLGEQGQVDEAIKQLQSMVNGSAGDAEAYRAIAQIYSQAKRFPDAEAAALKGISAASNPGEEEFGHFLLGSVYEREKKYDQAEGEFKKVLTANPLNAAASNYLGYMLADRGVRLEESVKYIKKALQIEPNNGAYLDSLGWAYFKMNQLEEAETQLEKAARLVTSDPTIHQHLGDIYYQMGKKGQAQEQWERALKDSRGAVSSDFDSEQAAKLEKKLQDLKTQKASAAQKQ